jgi:hypothetical protein
MQQLTIIRICEYLLEFASLKILFSTCNIDAPTSPRRCSNPLTSAVLYYYYVSIPCHRTTTVPRLYSFFIKAIFLPVKKNAKLDWLNNVSGVHLSVFSFVLIGPFLQAAALTSDWLEDFADGTPAARNTF